MPVERNIREILASGESTLLEADMSRRLDMLVRQGLMPVSKLPLLKRGLEKLQMGKVGTPQERDAINSLLNSMMFIVLGDDTVFQRARQHTQKNRYQAEESETVEEEMDMCNCDCDCDGPICDTCGLMKPVMECADEKDFKPHMMYDPKTGKGYMAKEYKDHVRMDKMGYTHDKPEVKEDVEQKDYRHTQQDSTELNGDGNRDRGRYGEDLTGDEKMFQFQPGNPFAKAKQQMEEGAYKRMATDDEEDSRLKAQKKAARLSKKMAKQERETDPGIKEAEEKEYKVKISGGKYRPGSTETMTVKGKSPEHAIAQAKKGHMNREKGEFSIHEDTIAEKFEELLEKNVPTNPKLWSKFKSQAKAKFDVYPSAYANGWAAKQYKKAGGSWRSESVEFDELADQLDEYITSKQVKMAKGIANDPRHKGGDMTGASKKMEKIKKGLSNHPGAKKALRIANEGVFDDYSDEELDELIEMEYKAKFQSMLKKTGKSLASMSPEEKKKFFNSVDAAHNAKNESYTMKNTYAKSGAMAKDKASHNTGGFRISNKDAAAAKQRLMQKKGIKEDAASDAKRDYDRDDKKGLAPTKKDKPAKVSDASNAKEIEHIVPQLRKAITVGKEVQFQDGKTHKISKGHAAKFLNKYMNSKPAQKSDMQSSAHKSHDHFMKHV